jgi:predicted small secreted protein
MKQIAVISTVLFLAFMQSGCGTQIGISGQAREDYMKSIKP